MLCVYKKNVVYVRFLQLFHSKILKAVPLGFMSGFFQDLKKAYFLWFDKSCSASILHCSLFILLTVRFGIEGCTLLQHWGSGPRGTRSWQLYESLHLQYVYCGNSYCNNIKKSIQFCNLAFLGCLESYATKHRWGTCPLDNLNDSLTLKAQVDKLKICLPVL